MPILIRVVALAALLAGCAGNARLKEVRALAAEAPKLNGYVELSQRYRDTYEREKPYLAPAADKREQAIDERAHVPGAALNLFHMDHRLARAGRATRSTPRTAWCGRGAAPSTRR